MPGKENMIYPERQQQDPDDERYPFDEGQALDGTNTERAVSTIGVLNALARTDPEKASLLLRAIC